MKHTPIILLTLLIAGCGRPYTLREKVAFGVFVGATVADYETSRRLHYELGRDGQFYERNPLLGKHPSQDELALFNVGCVGLFWGLGEIWPDSREPLFWLGAVLKGGAAGWNDRLYREYK